MGLEGFETIGIGTVLLLMLGGAAIFEGLLYAIIPATMQNAMREMINIPARTLHIYGTIVVVIGVVLVSVALR